MAIMMALGAVGSGVIAVLWGGWSKPMTVLCIMMALDYVSGLVVALVFRRSPKTKNGGLSSEEGLKGLLRKIFLILVVAAAYQVDSAIGTYFLRDAVALAFIANEAISLAENVGLMGIPIPKVLRKGIEVLKGKAEEELPEGEASHKDDHPPDGAAAGKAERSADE
jgi:toxin secretion/phage lysis holin